MGYIPSTKCYVAKSHNVIYSENLLICFGEIILLKELFVICYFHYLNKFMIQVIPWKNFRLGKLNEILRSDCTLHYLAVRIKSLYKRDYCIHIPHW